MTAADHAVLCLLWSSTVGSDDSTPADKFEPSAELTEHVSREWDRFREQLERPVPVPVRSARRFGYDIVNYPHLQKRFCGEFQGFCGFCRRCLVFPQDGSTSFRRNHRVY